MTGTRALRVVLGALVAALAVTPAGAEHELFYRFTVLGYVHDDAGAPRAQQAVQLVRDKTGFSYVSETDATGFFVIVARLGDEGAGEPLTLRVGRASARVVAHFDPANRVDERGTRVDVQGARFVERAGAFRSTLTNFLGATTR